MLNELPRRTQEENVTSYLPTADQRNGNGLFDALDQTFDIYTNISEVKGFTAAILIPDSAVVWKRASGLAQEFPDSVELTTEHSMGIGDNPSMIAATLLLMYEDGLLSLDDTIGMYLNPDYPNIPFHATIRNLLSERTGIYNYLNLNSTIYNIITTNPDSIWEADTILFNHVFPPYFPVDEDWSYSVTNIFLARRIIENISGKPWYEEVRERLLEPLGMVHTFTAPYEPLGDQLLSNC